MSYPEIIINSLHIKLIPLGDCKCGCENKTTIATQTRKAAKIKKGEPQRYCHGHNEPRIGKEHHNYTGGIKIDNGYIKELSYNHPRSAGGYVKQHILIAEKALGKYLPKGACIHHANGSRNSGPLVICQDTAYHFLLHQRTRAFKACGHASWRKCWICKQHDEPKNIITSGKSSYHCLCERKFQKSLRDKRKCLKKKAE